MNLIGLVGIFLMLSLLLAACGDNPTATPTPTPVPPTVTPLPATMDPSAIAKNAADKLAAVKYIHFIVDIKSGSVVIYNGITFKHAEGDFAQPNSYRAMLKVAVAIAQVDAQTVGIGDKQWILIPNLTQSWQLLPSGVGFNASVLFDPTNGLSAVVGKINNLTLDGSETISGTDCYRLKGVVSGKDISPLTAGTLGKNDVNFEVWVGKSDFMARQVTFKEISTDTNASNWQLNFSNFDQPVTINSPVTQ